MGVNGVLIVKTRCLTLGIGKDPASWKLKMMRYLPALIFPNHPLREGWGEIPASLGMASYSSSS